MKKNKTSVVPIQRPMVSINRFVGASFPFDLHVIRKLKSLGGMWCGQWLVDLLHEDAVKKICLENYGTDGERIDQVGVAVTLPVGIRHATWERYLHIVGMTMAVRSGRRIKQYDDVEIVAGELSLRTNGADRELAYIAPPDQPGKIIFREVGRTRAQEIVSAIQNKSYADEPPIIRAEIIRTGERPSGW